MSESPIDRLNRRQTLTVAGLMSGTSADGVDVAITRISWPGGRGNQSRRPSVKTLAAGMFPYPPALRQAIFRLFSPDTGRVDDICHLNVVIGEVFAESLLKLCRRSGIEVGSLDLIGSHGQTIHHLPDGRAFGRRRVGSTLQIGEPAVITQRTGVTVVADFRPADLAVGGQGAPLVPLADWVLLAHPARGRAVQNIGGIANVTYLPAGGGTVDILAFDTGPGNMIIDRLAGLLTAGRQNYDAGGRLAAAGTVNPGLLAELMRHPYLRRRPPKTTGREVFGVDFADELFSRAQKRGLAGRDIIATATAFTAASIADAYRRSLGQIDDVILCGGGARNKTLVAMLARQLPAARILDMSQVGIDPDAKEAISFAILAACTIRHLPGNVPSATGARRPVVLGKIVPA